MTNKTAMNSPRSQNHVPITPSPKRKYNKKRMYCYPKPRIPISSKTKTDFVIIPDTNIDLVIFSNIPRMAILPVDTYLNQATVTNKKMYEQKVRVRNMVIAYYYTYTLVTPDTSHWNDKDDIILSIYNHYNIPKKNEKK